MAQGSAGNGSRSGSGAGSGSSRDSRSGKRPPPRTGNRGSSGTEDPRGTSTGRPTQAGRGTQGGRPTQAGGSRPPGGYRGGDRGGASGGSAGSRRPAAGPADPLIPETIAATDLDRVTSNSLRTLPDGLAEIVARHLAAAAAVLADDPSLALAHTQAAARRAGRVAVVREANGVAAYTAGDYAQALTELRAAGRISGSSEYLPMMADCERGLGRPERALAMANQPEVASLGREGRVEMLIVAAGARRDLGQPEAAVLTLQVPALEARSAEEWLARLRYAYADALLEVGRVAEARTWFTRVVQVDPEGATDAAERLDDLAGIVFDEVAVGDDVAGDDVAGDELAVGDDDAIGAQAGGGPGSEGGSGPPARSREA